jgi:hypothetical protein
VGKRISLVFNIISYISGVLLPIEYIELPSLVFHISFDFYYYSFIYYLTGLKSINTKSII